MEEGVSRELAAVGKSFADQDLAGANLEGRTGWENSASARCGRGGIVIVGSSKSVDSIEAMLVLFECKGWRVVLLEGTRHSSLSVDSSIELSSAKSVAQLSRLAVDRVLEGGGGLVLFEGELKISETTVAIV